jgi:hypothetical protein
VSEHRLHKGLRLAHRLLGFAMADAALPVIGLVPEGQQIRERPAEGRGVRLLALDQVAHKEGVDPIVPPHPVGGRQRHTGVAQGGDRRMEMA